MQCNVLKHELCQVPGIMFKIVSCRSRKGKAFQHILFGCIGHALASPQALGGFHDRSVVQYNYACACVRCGRVRIAEIVLRRLIKNHGARANDLLEDPDFSCIRDEPWFQQLQIDAGEITD